MTWGELKAAVGNRVKFHGQTIADIDTTFGSAYDLLVLEAYRELCHESGYIFVAKQALTVALSDIELNLTSSTFIGSGYPIFEPTEIWINNALLDRVSIFDITEDLPTTPAAGRPTQYYLIKDGVVRLDRPCSSAFSNCFVSGVAMPKALVDNNSVLDFPDQYQRRVSEYIACRLASDVVSDAVQYELLQAKIRESRRFLMDVATSAQRSRMSVVDHV